MQTVMCASVPKSDRYIGIDCISLVLDPVLGKRMTSTMTTVTAPCQNQSLNIRKKQMFFHPWITKR